MTIHPEDTLVEPEFARQLQLDLPPDDVRRVLAVFAADLPKLMAELSAAARMQHAEALRAVAHALAGAAGAVGAEGLDQACRAAMRDETADAAALAAHHVAISQSAALAEAALQRVTKSL